MSALAVSERALGYLAENGCLPPGWSRSALVAWLAQNEVPCFDALVAWEESLHALRERRYLERSGCGALAGGCRERRSNQSLLLSNGVRYATIATQRDSPVPKVQEHDGLPLVLFGTGALGSYLYMDAGGRVFELRPPFPSAPRLAAESPLVHLERAIVAILCEEAPAHLCCEAPADRLREMLALPLIPEASDAVERFHGDDGLVVRQAEARYVDAFVLRLDDARRLLHALAELGARAFVPSPAPEPVFEPLRSAPALGESESAVRMWSFGDVRGSIAWEGGALVQVSGRDVESRRRVVSKTGASETRWCLLEESDLGEFSTRARRYLLTLNARRDPVDAAPDTELERMLQSWGLPSYAALRAVNARWGGFAWGNHPGNQLGTFAILAADFPNPDPPLPMRKRGSPRDLALDWEDRELVVIGSTSSTLMYLDHDGSIVEYDAYADCLFRSAENLIKRIEFEAALGAVYELDHYLENAVAGAFGAELAEALDARAVAEASDSVRSWWIGERVSLNELYSPSTGERITCIYAADDERMKDALAVAQSLRRG